jgi:hypothetical protein
MPMKKHEMIVIQAYGSPVGKIKPDGKAQTENKINRILAKEFRKRHAVRLIKIME